MMPSRHYTTGELSVEAGIKQLTWVTEHRPDLIGGTELETYPLAIAFKWHPWSLTPNEPLYERKP